MLRSAKERKWNKSLIKMPEKFFSCDILMQLLKNPVMRFSWHKVRVSFAPWRLREDSQIPVFIWHYGFPIITTWQRRVNIWSDWKIICTMTFKGKDLFVCKCSHLSLTLWMILFRDVPSKFESRMFCSALSRTANLWLALCRCTFWL